MSFKLKELVVKVRCRAPGCAFFHEVVVKENIMGATEADVDSEGLKIARDMAYLKHDATFGRHHALENPELSKVSGSYEQLGTGAPGAHPAAAHPTPAPVVAPGVPTKSYLPGQIIIKKGQSAATVCEVIKGSALNEKLPDMLYKPGTTFGSSAIFRNKSRMADIVAGSEGATIAFYDLKDLMRTNPAKARELYEESLEDLFQIVHSLEDYGRLLEKRVQTLEKSKPAAKKAPVKKAPKAKRKTVVKKSAAKKAAKKKAAKKGKK